MVSARRHRRVVHKKRSSFAPLLKILTFLAVLLFAFLFVKLNTRYWNGHDKLIFTSARESGDVGVVILDPRLDEMTVLTIPGDTEVEVAKGYGTLRLKNVWKLAINEKLDGKLVASTVTKNFLFPVFLWSDEKSASIFEGNSVKILSFVLFPGKTNIPLGDRLSIALFVLNVKNVDRAEVDLAKSQFLRKEKLNDGQSGYRLAGPISGRLTVYFSDNDFAEKNLRVYIVDGTGIFGVSEKVGQILEVLGGKVVSVDKAEVAEDECKVLGKDLKSVKKVANILSCKVSKEKTDFDIEVRLDSEFGKNF